MKSSTKYQAEGKFHKMKGKIKEIAGKVGMNPELENEGKDENLDGKVQEKIGQIEKVVGKQSGVTCAGTPLNRFWFRFIRRLNDILQRS